MNVKSKQRTEYIGIRVTPEEKEMVYLVAEVMNVSVTRLLLTSALTFADVYSKIAAELRDFVSNSDCL